MAERAPLAAHARAGRIAPGRLGVRYRDITETGDTTGETTGGAATELVTRADALTPGTRSVGPLSVMLERVDHGQACTIDWRVHNPSGRQVYVESVLLGARWTRRPPGSVRFLRHGWQSWSFSGFRALDAAGEPAFPSGPWIRSMHHAVDDPPADRAGWHESATVTVAGVGTDGPACLLGALERGRGFAVVYLRPRGDGDTDRDPDIGVDIDIEIEIRLEVPLAPGETRPLESIRVALDSDDARLLERFATLWGRTAGARVTAPLLTGWCSWYHYFHAVTEADILSTLDKLAGARADIPIDVVQVDDGYQRAVGDWLATNSGFPRGLAPLAGDIRAAGFRPGLWTAPLCAVPESQLYQSHPDWLLQRNGAPFPALVHGTWSARGWVHALDPTRPEVYAHLRQLFRTLADMGWSYLKLDFLHAVAMRAQAADPTATRAERLRQALQAIRDGAGEDAYLLGCGCPLGPAVGVVDAMRIGPDVAPHWEVRELHAPGLASMVAATRNAVHGVVHRMWMHRRLWLNDPDCLLARSTDNDLTAGEMRALSAVIAATGGPVVFSDDITALTDSDRARIRDVIELARRVDRQGPPGAARASGWRGSAEPHATAEALVAHRSGGTLLALLNASESDAQRTLADYIGEHREITCEPRLDTAYRAADGTATPEAMPLKARDAAVFWLPQGRDLAVFCDFDGTLITSDVWIQVMRRHVPERLPDAWRRYRSGERTIWEITVELADGLTMPETELDRMLEQIELDPGARALISWCEASDVPFRVLSDGFATVIERLRSRFGLSFPIEANQLRFREGTWQLAPGAPDPRCGCGTGTCKRGRIAAWRAAHPRALCVFIGNGMISDLCGAMAADWVFAKDSLAEALAARGVDFQRYADLGEVAAALAGSLAG